MNNKKHIIIEIILVLVVIIQGVAIYLLYDFSKNNFLKDAIRVMDDYSCMENSKKYYELYDNGNYNEFIDFAESLYNDGYEDKMLLSHLASACFIIGNERKAAEYIELSLLAGFKCKIVEPSFEDTKLMEEAFARYNLSEIYMLLGEKDKAHKEHDKAHSIAKMISGDKYTYDIVENKIFKGRSLVEARKYILSK